MRLEVKREIVKQLNETFLSTQTAYLVDYRGLNVAEITALRTDLRKFNVKIQVMKNSLVRLACKGTPLEAFEAYLTGPVAITFADERPVDIAKTLLGFIESHPQLEIKTGILQGKKIHLKEIEELSKLPPIETLYIKLLSLMTTSIHSLYNVLQGNSRMLLRVPGRI